MTTRLDDSLNTLENHKLLGAADIRKIASTAGVSPTKKFGQNFVIDPGTVRKIARIAQVSAEDYVIEVGPGLGSLTLAILETGANVQAIEIDPTLAQQLPQTIETYMPEALNRFRVLTKDALEVTPADIPHSQDHQQIHLIANLPYNVATPIIITLLERFANLASFVVMVQKEVADRLCATPGSKIYGVPSIKLAWFGISEKAVTIGRNVFWPAPNVDSALVKFEKQPNAWCNNEHAPNRETTFELIDAAFRQRRKTLHAALKNQVPEEAYDISGINPTRRGETLTIDEFTKLALAVEKIQNHDEK
ncbi:MAG: 16S rRNA (adenine(1518)-N(6)/adenine(1519)-N(6))-dimethyltransferase RsmA [Bifidobacteriaceae bacterium]|nr:16S rRNA (adenine(1518)-N(6)/adenine(1519)-N(6))-dimethyltransferase RsmA [Bifidobacteriaceae bacterium]